MTPYEIMERLRKACKERRVCRIQMEGEPEERLVNPHGVGRSTKGNLIIVCIRVKGFTQSANKENFRNLTFDKCESVEMLDRKFSIDKDFEPQAAQYKDWLFHVLMNEFPDRVIFKTDFHE